MITKNDSFAFDECSLLHLCEIDIPKSFRRFFSKDKIIHKNFSNLNQLRNKLDFDGISKFRFDPLNIEPNIIKVANDLLSKEGNQAMILPATFKTQILDQLKEFVDDKIEDFKKIPKDNNIHAIRPLFTDNEKDLKKEKNIPEDDDLSILSGYSKFISSGSKYLISEDEHFWGYSDLIKDNFSIIIIKEWECYKVCLSP